MAVLPLPPDWAPGDVLSAASLGARTAAIAATRSTIGTGSGLAMAGTGSGLGLRNDHARPILGLLSGSSSPYSFTQSIDQVGGTVAPGTRVGKAYEVNGKTGLAGQTPRLYPDRSGNYRFQWVGRGGAPWLYLAIQFQCIACVADTPTYIGGQLVITGDGVDRTVAISLQYGASIRLAAGTYSYTLTTIYGVQTGSFTSSAPSTRLVFEVQEAGNPNCPCNAPESVTLSVSGCAGGTTGDPNPVPLSGAIFTCQSPPIACFDQSGNAGVSCYPPGYKGMFSQNMSPYGGVPVFYELTCGGCGTGSQFAVSYTIFQRAFTGGGTEGYNVPQWCWSDGSDDPFGWTLSINTTGIDGDPCTAVCTLS